ncbi:MAG: TonB-dependent receptor [Methylophaga sp.]|nr:MAG: TonB-dependent receptor [Methylophaga sp.]
MKFKTLSAVIAAILSANAFAEDSSTELPSMTVSADFRPSLAQDTPVSLTIIGSEIIASRGAQHIEDVLNLAPNVNISSGASRGQYFQIRGIGERSQFSAPINPSVGLIIDGIDFSRTGGAATLFDIEQVEIFRGPQGTRFGSNALAGVINMQSKQPSEELEVHVETGIADYNTHHLGIAVGGALVENKLLGRASIHTYQSDGYMDNDFLNRDNTHNRDEITARGQLKWLVSNRLTVDLNVLHLNIDNGYDAFTLDNNRNSLADEPGEDTQRTNAFALKTDWRASDAIQLQSTVTYMKSDVVYSYDADWGFIGQFAPALFPYTGFEEFKRDRENYSFELKALSNEQGLLFNGTTEWVVGLYYLSQDEDLDLDSPWTPLVNEYQTRNTAVFGQFDSHLTEKLTLITGLRVEYFEADYKDSNALDIDTSETLFGGKLGLNYQVNDDQLLYTSLSRGYKSGGVNNNDALPVLKREFDTEYMWSLEAGVKSSWLEGDLITNINAFYSLRRDAQVDSSVVVGIGEFEDSIANAAKGTNYGIEADLDWSINNQWRLFAAIGLLNAKFDEYDNPDLSSINVEDRRQAHAPVYQFNIGSEMSLSQNWTFRVNLEGKDDFYFSNSHNEKSRSYALVNSSLDYKNGDWKVTLWGRNLFDREYATRGFFFGNNPSKNYVKENYTQQGDPRVVGLSLSYDY